MTEHPLPCRHDGSTEPRKVRYRHADDCPTVTAPDGCPGCPGCLPCTARHCPVCTHRHADGTCAECLAATREDLHQIAELCGSLPTEAAHRGVNSEAAMLHGPAADPEAWRNRATSAMFGRVSDAYLEDCRDELHPTWTLGTWEQLWREHLDQPTDLTATPPRLVDYLDRHMSHMAGLEEPPFEDFAREVRQCRGHLQTILGDQNQGDRANVGCFDCGGGLERKLTEAGFEDQWTCRKCRRKYTIAEYNFALRAKLEEGA